jgi:hypothetical protein
MNPLGKIAAGTMLGLLAVVATERATQAAEGLAAHFPDFSTATAEAGQLVAVELQSQLREALEVPRPPRVRRPPTVQVFEGEMVLVEASRPPSNTPKQAKAMPTSRIPL